MIKHLGTSLKRPQVLLCFDYQNDITNEEKDLMFTNEPELISISTINFPLKTMEIVVVNKIQIERTIETTNAKTQPFCNFRSSAKIALEKKPEISLEGQKHTRVSQFQHNKVPFQSPFVVQLKTSLKYEYLGDIENNFFSISNFKS